MKAMRILALILALCLCLAGCQKQAQESTASTDATDPTGTAGTRPQVDPEDGIAFQLGGRTTVTYSVNISHIKYITSAADLPNYEALADYDEAWFEEHALVVILQSVANGNMSATIDCISLEDDLASVTLRYAADASYGSAQAITWLIWTEVETGLDYTWQIANPAVESSSPSV